MGTTQEDYVLFEQILEAALNKTAAAGSLTSIITSHSC